MVGFRSSDSSGPGNGPTSSRRSWASWSWWRKRVIAVSGWRRRLLAAGLGILAAAALPPLHVLVLLIPAFVGLIWLTDAAAGWRRAFAVGWWFGFGHFAAGLYWLAFAFMVQPEKFAWMAPFAVLGMAAVMAVFPALAVVLGGIGRTRGVGRILLFGVAWTTLEWVRSWIFTGFPWNLMGTVWVMSDAMMQVAAIAGVYGLGLLSVVAAAMPAVLADDVGARGARRGMRRGGVAVAAVAALLAVVWAGGMIRLAGAGADTVEGVRLRLVQPNIPQKIKWRRELRLRHVLLQMRMGSRPATDAGRATDPPTHVIWAETAVPFALAGDKERLGMVGSATPAGGLTITGAPRTTPPGQPFQVWNSLHAIDRAGRVVATYDKFHLVPFGEYVPFRELLKFSRLVPGGSDFSAGPGQRTLHLPGLPPVGPLICYEVVFPGAVVDSGDRPEWLLNLTNDGWYGRSAGPYQHFAAARLRAVEEGLPLVRVANTGISAVIDPYGRLVAGLGLGGTGVVDSALPRAVAGITVYGRFGNWTVFLLLLLTAAAGFTLSRDG
jgi:apolipoprotein N-acyltransferase